MYFRMEDEFYDKTINTRPGGHLDVDIGLNNHFLLLFISHTLEYLAFCQASNLSNLQEDTLK